MDSGGAKHVVSSVVERLSDLLNEKGKLLSTRENDNAWRIVGQLRRIEMYLSPAGAMLIGEAKIMQSLADIKQIANDARDVLESHICKVEAWGWIGGVRRNAFNNIPIIRKRAGLKSKDIEDRISEIANRLRSSLQNSVMPGNLEISSPQNSLMPGNRESSSSQNSVMPGNRESSSSQNFTGTSTSTGWLTRSVSFVVNEDDDFVGFEEEIKLLVGKLVGDRSDTLEEVTKIVCIHGADGMGKTSIARKIYNHPRVKRHFSAFAWVNTFSEFEAGMIMRQIVLSLGGPLVRRYDELVPNLTRELQTQRCLVVFDDVELGDFLGNKNLEILLTNNGNSKFIFTCWKDCRAANCFLYEAKCLNEDES